MLRAALWRAGAGTHTQVAVAGAEGEPIQLNEVNFEHVIKDFDVVMVNFYADWCRFCQQLRPVYEQAAQLLGDSISARLARVDCEAAGTQ